MAEAGGPVFEGSSARPEVTKFGKLKEWLRKRFTPQGAKEVWYEKPENKKKMDEFQKIQDSLTPEQRAEALKKFESNASKSAWWNVGKNYVLAASATAATVFTGLFAFHKGFRGEVIRRGKNFIWEVQRISGELPDEIRSAVREMKERVDELRDGVREKTATLRDDLQERGEKAREALKNMKKKKGEPPSTPPST